MIMVNEPVVVTAVGEERLSEWRQFVLQNDRGTFCHLPNWSRSIERTWNHRPCHLLALRNQAIVGVLPLFHVKSRILGACLVSTPNAVYGGALGNDEASRHSMVEAAKSLGRRLRVRHVELRNTFETQDTADGELVTNSRYVRFEHPITADEDALMASLPRDIRRMIRLGHKQGLTARTGGAELLDRFYDVYATSVRNLGTPVFPKRLFANFLEEFPSASDILLAEQGSRVAGGVLSFYFRDTVLPYYGGAYPEFYPAGVNNFMYYALMKNAAARGYSRFDFGRSKVGTGACAFKRGWKMREQPLPYKYFLVRSTRVPDATPLNPRFKIFIDGWKRLPLAVTKVIGPPIVRHLP